ncbi:hypothetical protein [Thermovibrio sp.]
MKKPPYRAYRSKKKEEKTIEIPEKIDTPQAEQLVSDFYKLLEVINRHKGKLLLGLALLLIIGGSYLGYSFYTSKVESEAAQVVDKGLYYLNKGEEKKGVKLLQEAVKKYKGAPSAKLAQFILGKIEKREELLKPLASSKDFLFSPPSKTTLITWGIDKGKVPPYKVERDRWTHPEYLYDEFLIALKERRLSEAKNYLDALNGDYKGLPITQLAREILR